MYCFFSLLCVCVCVCVHAAPRHSLKRRQGGQQASLDIIRTNHKKQQYMRKEGLPRSNYVGVILLAQQRQKATVSVSFPGLILCLW